MKKTSTFQNGLIWFGAGVSLAEILTGTSFAPLGMAKGLAAILIGHIIGCAMMSGKAWSSPTPGEHGRDACATTGRILLCCCLFFLHAFYYFWLLPIFYDVPRPHSFGLLI